MRHLLQIEVSHRKQEDIPSGWGCDADGRASTDAGEVLDTGGLFPLGGAEETSEISPFTLP